jgi:hypothetical protein
MNKLPKICHLMWDGSPMAYLQVLTVISFHKLNPDWKIIIYVPKQSYKELGANTYVPDYIGQDYFQMLKICSYVEIQEVDLEDYGIDTSLHFILCSDQLRMQVLYRDGGLYTDFDVIWVRPVSELINMNCIGDVNDFDASVCYHKDTEGWSNIAVLLAQPKSPYILELIEGQRRLQPPFSHQSYGTDLIDSFYPTYSSIVARHPKTLGIRYKTLYPYDITKLKWLYKADVITPIQKPDVLCVHWFNGHQLSKDYINFDEYDRPCSMTSILNYLGLNKSQL